MFKKLSCILLILIIVLSFAACGKQEKINENSLVNSSVDSKKETESKSEENSAPKSNIVFKEEILEIFGQTYKDLTEKYGSDTEVIRYEGAPHLTFKNYLEWGGMVFEGFESYDADYSAITEKDKVSMLVFKANEAFDNDKGKIYISDLEKLFESVITVSINEMSGGFFVDFKYKEFDFSIDAKTPEYISPDDVVRITK